MQSQSVKSVYVLVFVCLIAFSFNVRPGGHSFQVFVDDKLVIENFVRGNAKAPVVHLTASSKRIDLRYNECGRTVSGRKLSVKDRNGKLLKTWSFDGTTTGYKDAMSLSVKELESFAGYGDEGLQIFYSSHDFTEGIQVCTVIGDGDKVGP